MTTDQHNLINAVLAEFGADTQKVPPECFAPTREAFMALQAENAKLRTELASARKYRSEAIFTDYAPQCVPHGDWSAYRKDYEPGQPLGHGATELAAITALLEEEDGRDE